MMLCLSAKTFLNPANLHVMQSPETSKLIAVLKILELNFQFERLAKVCLSSATLFVVFAELTVGKLCQRA